MSKTKLTSSQRASLARASNEPPANLLAHSSLSTSVDLPAGVAESVGQLSNRQRRKLIMKDAGWPGTPAGDGIEWVMPEGLDKELLVSKWRSLIANPDGGWTADDTRQINEIRALCRKAAAEWTCPTGTPTTAANFELLTMNTARVLGVVSGIWDKYDFVGDPEAWDVVSSVIGRDCPAYDRVIQRVANWVTVMGREDPLNGWNKAWLECSFARLEVSHKLAAALCCTDVPEDLEVRAPWEAWSLVLPDGLLPHLTIARIWLSGTTPVAYLHCTGVLEPLHLNPQIPHSSVERLFHNLIRGACLALSNPDDFRKHETRAQVSAKSKQRSAPPDLTQARFMLSAPVSIDLREHIRASLEGGKSGGAPTVQFLVRGHWRNQVHGPKRALRKHIWIQPFWKGPQESRILLRQHTVKEPSDP